MAKRPHVQSANKLYFKGNLMVFQKIYIYENPRYGALESIGTSRPNQPLMSAALRETSSYHL